MNLFVLVFICKIHKFFESERRHADFFFMFPGKILGAVRIVEGTAFRILAGARMVPADDEIVGAKVSADDHVPERFARPCHSHCQRQQRKRCAFGIVIILNQGVDAPDPGKVIDIARGASFRRWVNQKAAIDHFHGVLGEFLVTAVHRISRLKRDDIVESFLYKSVPGLPGAKPEMEKVCVGWKIDHTEWP